LQRGYFNGYALWTYLTTPFLLWQEHFPPSDVSSIVEAQGAAGALPGHSGLERAGLDVTCLDVLCGATDKGRHQGSDGAVHVGRVCAYLAGNRLRGNLIEQLVETGHGHLRC
jgi:hypothetical protein